MRVGTDRAVSLRPGARFVFDGEAVEVTAMEGGQLTLRDARDRWRTVSLPVFLAQAVIFEENAESGAVSGGSPVGMTAETALATLSAAERQRLSERADHVREVMSGYRSGAAERAAAGEPRPEYDPQRTRPTSWAFLSARCIGG